MPCKNLLVIVVFYRNQCVLLHDTEANNTEISTNCYYNTHAQTITQKCLAQQRIVCLQYPCITLSSVF